MSHWASRSGSSAVVSGGGCRPRPLEVAQDLGVVRAQCQRCLGPRVVAEDAAGLGVRDRFQGQPAQAPAQFAVARLQARTAASALSRAACCTRSRAAASMSAAHCATASRMARSRSDTFTCMPVSQAGFP